MQFRIGYVADKGDLDRERLVLQAKRNADIGDFLLIRTSVEDGEVTTDVSDSLWFPYRPVRTGDLVVVYTKSGADRKKRIEGGRTAHFFYWGQDASLWGDEEFAPVLLHAPDWVSKAV